MLIRNVPMKQDLQFFKILRSIPCLNKVPALIADPVFLMFFILKHYVWICLKLWRRDDFVILPRIRNVVFVPRYARNLFIDH